MNTSSQQHTAVNVQSGTAGGVDGDSSSIGGDDDDCFNIELDDEPPDADRSGTQDLNKALGLLNGNTPDAVLEGLQLVEQHLSSESWRMRFFNADLRLRLNAQRHADGASQCLELMGVFSAPEVQSTAAHVCASLAKTGHKACVALLEGDVGSMLQAHIKQPDARICMFENAALITAAVANNAGEAGHALTQLGLMAHLCGALAADSRAPHSARTAALTAVTSLCCTQPQAVLNFLQYGGVNTLLQALLQPERTHDEALAAVTLFEGVLARLPECRDLMGSVRGMEVLAQAHRDAEARGQDALRLLTVSVLAQLTFRHPKNLAMLQSDTQLLGIPGLYHEVLAMHERSEMSPRYTTMFPLQSASLPTLSLTASRDSGSSGEDSSPPNSARGGMSVPGRKPSFDSGSRAFRRMSSSVRNVFGSVRKLMKQSHAEEDARHEESPLMGVPQQAASLPLHATGGSGAARGVTAGSSGRVLVA